MTGEVETLPLPSGIRILDVHPSVKVAAAGAKSSTAGYKGNDTGCKMAAAGYKLEAAGWNEQDLILLVFWICLWIPKNSPQSRIALVIRKSYQNTKT